MNDQETPSSDLEPTPRTPPRQYRSRLERRTYRRAQRARKKKTRLALTTGLVVVIVAVVVVLVLLVGGGPKEGVYTPAGVPAEEGDAGLILVIEQEGEAPAVVLIQPRNGRGVVLGMSGLTLLKTSDGFRTLSELHLSGQDAALAAAVAEALAVRIAAVASVEWSQLRSEIEKVPGTELPPVHLTGQPGEAVQVAQATVAVLGAAIGGSGAEVWMQLPLEGEADDFCTEIQAVARGVPAGDWEAAELTGRLVKGEGFVYLEPDVMAAKLLLDGTVGDLSVKVQVQNGSGVVGVTEQVERLLESLGYVLLPARNSPDFPNVQRTRIMVPRGADDEGTRLQRLLGAGTIAEDAALEPGQVVVVLGKDYGF